ncbi:UNVERIFIED_CONTAM: hypothetical protein HDU68_002323 [Siphonaria sp. JEL0065]|nr:hypothetical protein HDU68_002323 [Siphonaria sp. JEL0065]
MDFALINSSPSYGAPVFACAALSSPSASNASDALVKAGAVFENLPACAKACSASLAALCHGQPAFNVCASSPCASAGSSYFMLANAAYCQLIALCPLIVTPVSSVSASISVSASASVSASVSGSGPITASSANSASTSGSISGSASASASVSVSASVTASSSTAASASASTPTSPTIVSASLATTSATVSTTATTPLSTSISVSTCTGSTSTAASGSVSATISGSINTSGFRPISTSSSISATAFISSASAKPTSSSRVTTAPSGGPTYNINCNADSNCNVCIADHSSYVSQVCIQGEKQIPLVGSCTFTGNTINVCLAISNSTKPAQICSQGSKGAIPCTVPVAPGVASSLPIRTVPATATERGIYVVGSGVKSVSGIVTIALVVGLIL